MPKLRASIMNGIVMAMVRMARSVCSLRAWLALRKRSSSWAARTKALTTRTPARFSCMTMLRASSRCWTPRKSGKARRITKTMSAMTKGISTTKMRASCGLVSTAMTTPPTTSRGARTMMRSAINTSSCTWVTSLVRRVIRAPVSSSSRLGKERVWILA